MCRLFLQVALEPILADEFLLQEENSLLAQSLNDSSGRPNADGWGVSWLDREGNVKFIKNTVPAFEDNIFIQVAEEVEAEIILAHIRRGSIGEVNYHNTHPFVFNGWAFAHNGNIPPMAQNANVLDPLIKSEYKNMIKGTTDSEHLFYALLSIIDEAKPGSMTDMLNAVSGLVQKVKRVMKDDTNNSALNFLLICKDFQVGYRLNRPLYFMTEKGKIVVASEKINYYNKWSELPEDSYIIVKDKQYSLFSGVKEPIEIGSIE